MSLCSELIIVMSFTIFPWKWCAFVLSTSCLYTGSCLIYDMCDLLSIVVSNTYCVVFFFFVCTLCCQFLWMGHFLLPLRYSLTFINRILTNHKFIPLFPVVTWFNRNTIIDDECNQVKHCFCFTVLPFVQIIDTNCGLLNRKSIMQITSCCEHYSETEKIG